MEHVVFYPGPDAAPSFRRFASLEEAVRFVEHLRNVENVSEVSVHALTPVPVAFRAYYKVEVPMGDMPADLLPVEVPAQAVEPMAEPVVESDGDDAEAAAVLMAAELADVPGLVDDAEPVLVPVPSDDGDSSSNGKRSLGFFAH